MKTREEWNTKKREKMGCKANREKKGCEERVEEDRVETSWQSVQWGEADGRWRGLEGKEGKN